LPKSYLPKTYEILFADYSLRGGRPWTAITNPPRKVPAKEISFISLVFFVMPPLRFFSLRNSKKQKEIS
ncbi:MAG: hypothetical protein LIP02_10705, partial [Bacteroidales bacterium]|nr:hypothetical protein [Bacteroidales bacterium]